MDKLTDSELKLMLKALALYANIGRGPEGAEVLIVADLRRKLVHESGERGVYDFKVGQ